MLSFKHTKIEPAGGFYNMWECYAYSSNERYYSELGHPAFIGNPGRHHVIVFGRNARVAKRKVDRLISRLERKFNY